MEVNKKSGIQIIFHKGIYQEKLVGENHTGLYLRNNFLKILRMSLSFLPLTPPPNPSRLKAE